MDPHSARVDPHSTRVDPHSTRVDPHSTRIRLVEEGDAEALAAHLARDAEAFAPWDPERPAEYYTAGGQRRNIATRLAKHKEGTLWPGVVLAGDEVIGQITVQDILQRAWRKANLGYWIATTHQGRGHATRAVALLVELMAGELGLHRAEAFTQMDNVRSQHVLRRNGFVAFGVSRSHIFVRGEWRDEVLWERLLDQ